MLPLVARAFGELGYRRATTAALAKRCGVRENVLYRAWPTKKAMFLAAIGYLWQRAEDIWSKLIAESGTSGVQAARLIMDHESKHHGETGLYKVIFAGLSEAHDPEIAAAFRQMYRKFHQFIAKQIGVLRAELPGGGSTQGPTDEVRAWGMLGVATMIHIDRELGLFRPGERSTLFSELEHVLIGTSCAKKTGR